MRVLWIFLGLLLLGQSEARAQTKKTKKKREHTNRLGPPPSKNVFDQSHEYLSTNILSFSEGIDQFFADERTQDVVNNSTLRFQTLSMKRENEEVSHAGDFRFNLVLPRTQKKLHLFVEGQGQDDPTTRSDPDQVNNAAGRSTTDPGRSTNQSQRINNATTAGLRYLTDVAGIKTWTDTGVRVNMPPQLFARLRLTREIPLNRSWLFRPREEVLWVDREGLSSTTNFDFDNKLNIDLLLRMVNKVYWSEQDDYAMTLTNGPSLFHRITDRKGFSYHAHIISSNEPEMMINNHVLSMSYRQALYKSWFFGEVSPQLTFPRSENFARTPVLLVKFEIILGDI